MTATDPAGDPDRWVPDPMGDGLIRRGRDPSRHRAAADHMPRLPISVLDARTGWWADRKRRWRDLIGHGGETREHVTTGGGVQVSAPMGARPIGAAGGSTFDPVLAELLTRWYAVPGGTVLDPFAGGATRGMVAAHFGQRYHGIDIRPAQVAANQRVAQGQLPAHLPTPTWESGDATNLADTTAPTQADLLLTCPPYADLERYSDDPRDLSTMTYPRFREAHTSAITQACARLGDDRYAVWVVGEARGRDGGLYGIVPDTIAALRAAGLTYLSEAVMVTPVGNLPIRAPGLFFRTRALHRAHQTVLVFVKGDRRRAMRATRDGPAQAAGSARTLT